MEALAELLPKINPWFPQGGKRKQKVVLSDLHMFFFTKINLKRKNEINCNPGKRKIGIKSLILKKNN